MSYSHITWGTLKAQLSARLHDPAKTFWVDAELGVYLTEALRTFSLLSMYWRTQASFSTSALTFHYDLPTALPAAVGYTVTDRSLINAIQHHLQEPATSSWAGGWTGTAMFTLDDVASALQRRRDQFLVETGIVVSRSAYTYTPAAGRVTLLDSSMDVRRAAWVDDAGYSHLWRTDERELTMMGNSWVTGLAQTPLYYSIMSPPPITMQLAPAPTETKVIEIISVSSGPVLAPTASATVLGIPDDMSWIVKWGALADLLSKDGPAQDPARAKYCEARYEEGLKLAMLAPMIINARIAGVPVLIHAIVDMDSYKPNWQNDTAAIPTDILTAGRNLIYMYPKPLGVTSVMLDLVQNAPIPVNDGAQVEIGREQLDAIIGYAEHLAMFKVAGEEWHATNSGYENLVKLAMNYNSRLKTMSKYLISLHGLPTKEEVNRPRLQPGVNNG